LKKKNVLVVGASGRVGGVFLKTFGDRYELSALNRRSISGVPCHSADISDLDAILPAFRGIDTVLTLVNEGGLNDWERQLPVNIIGVRNIYEAARINAVNRVVFTSSGATILGYGLDTPYREVLSGEYNLVPETWPLVNESWPVRPDSVYGATKVWGEALGRYYSDYHGLSVICVRLGAFLAYDSLKGSGPNIGNPNQDDAVALARRPESQPSSRVIAGYTSHEDAMRMFRLCIEADESIRYDLFELVSDNRYRWRDNSHSKEVLGFTSTKNSDSFS